jgi:hypothetical protein
LPVGQKWVSPYTYCRCNTLRHRLRVSPVVNLPRSIYHTVDVTHSDFFYCHLPPSHYRQNLIQLSFFKTTHVLYLFLQVDTQLTKSSRRSQGSYQRRGLLSQETGSNDRKGFWDSGLGCSFVVSSFLSYIYTYEIVYTVEDCTLQNMEARPITLYSDSLSGVLH